MRKRLGSLLQKVFEFSPAPGAASELDPALACAVLLVEMSRSDYSESEVELAAIDRLIQNRFGLSAEQRSALLQDARSEAEASVSLHRFTRALTDGLSEAERGEIVGMLWEVVFADGEVDVYEEHLLRRIAELLYVPHSEFIRQKLLAQKNRG